MTRTNLKLILLLIVFSEVQAQLIYLFSEDGDAPICPTIVPSQASPSFILEPDSSNPLFRNGSYSYPDINNIIPGGRFSEEHIECSNDRFATCSRLSLLYNPPDSVDGGIRGSFTIIYTASNQATRMINIEFGSKGIYLREPGQMLVRQPDQPGFLNDSLLVYDILSPLALCYENGTKETEANFIVIESTCSSRISSDGPNVQPGKFNILIPLEITGRHRIYVAGGECNSTIRSVLFDVILDPPIQVPTPFTTQPPGTTTTQPTISGLSLGAVIGIAVVVALLVVIAVVLFIILLVWCKKRHKEVTHRSEHQLPPGVEGHDREHSPEIPSNRSERTPLVDDVHVQPPPPQMLIQKVYILLSVDHEKVKQLKQKLCENFSNRKLATLPNDENGNFERYLQKIKDEQHVVIILGDIGEITYEDTSQSKKISLGRKCLHVFASSPAFSEKLQYVFLVRFGTKEPVAIYENKFHQIQVLQHPDNDDFDPPGLAKSIHESIEDKLASLTSDQNQVSNHLRPNGNFSHSTSHPPLHTGSSPETSEKSLKVPATENETGIGEISDMSTSVDETDAARNLMVRGQGSPKPLTDPRLNKIKDQNPVPGTLNSDSAASFKEYFDELKKVMKEEGDKGRAVMREEGDKGRAVMKEEGELGRAAIKEVQEDVAYLGDTMEESLKRQEQSLNQVIQPGDNTT